MSSPRKSGSNLFMRIAAAAIMVPFALFVTWWGGWLFNLFIAVLGVLMALEWVKIVHNGDRKQQILHILAVLVAVLSIYIGQFALPVLLIIVITIASMSCKGDDNGFWWPLLGVPYLSFSIMALVWLRLGSDLFAVPVANYFDRGLATVLTLFAAVWIADSMAYFAGRGIGGPKLWPSVSPNKTWAGFFGAVLGGALGAVLVFWVFGVPQLFYAAILGAAIGGIEQGGDLLESAAKRKFGIKDSGAIIPGHGGVLDRVDGLMAASIVAWVYGACKAGTYGAAMGFIGW